MNTDWSSYQKVKNGNGMAMRLLSQDAAAWPTS
jgi:hypothetical protein